MEATILDLRYKMREVLKALSRNESVTILYHGKKKGVLSSLKQRSGLKMVKHPFFGMRRNEKESVEEIMQNLRGGRYGAL